MISEELVVRHEVMGDPSHKLMRLVLQGTIAKKAKPGQFVHVKVSSLSSHDPLLRRPISISSINAEQDEVTLLYRIQGKGTELLARTPVGERLNIMGPLGNGFSFLSQGELLLVAGGIGAFPLYALAQSAKQSGTEVKLFWGGDNKSFLESAGLNEWNSLGVSVYTSTLDGSLGTTGLVTDIFEEYLEKNSSALAGQFQVKSCGPNGMLKAVAEKCRKAGLEAEVSLEERMGCAVGACLGCVVTLKDNQGKLKRAKVCQDGPVFRGREVEWDAQC